MAYHLSKLLACLSFAVCGLAGSGALAAGCVPGRAALPESVLAGYRTNPGELLRDSGRSVGAASSRIRNAVASDSEMIAALVPTIRAASGDDAKSIGLGLGSAAQICARSFPAASQSIQRAVEESGNADVQQAFASVIGDQPVLSTGPGYPGGVAPGQATLGGGPHRPTDTPSYGFASSNPQISSGSLLSPSGGGSSSVPISALSSSSFAGAFLSVSGVRP